jgi:hypothetical protein
MGKLSRYPIKIDEETVEIGTAAELSVALDVLQGQYDLQVLMQLRPHLHEIIPQAKDFFAVMKSLSAKDQIYLIAALGPKLAGIIQEARHLRDLLATMADTTVEEALISTLGRTGLRALILTAAELASVLEWVYGQCDALVLDLIGYEHVRRLCRTADDLSEILRSLDHGMQEKLVKHLGWEIVLGLVHDGKDLAALLRALPAVASDRLLNHYTHEQLVEVVGNAHDWAYLYHRLKPAEAETITKILKLNQPGRKSHA